MLCDGSALLGVSLRRCLGRKEIIALFCNLGIGLTYSLQENSSNRGLVGARLRSSKPAHELVSENIVCGLCRNIGGHLAMGD